MTWRVYIEEQPWRNASRIHMDRLRGDGKIDMVMPLHFTTIEEEEGALAVEDHGILGDVTRSEIEDFFRGIMDAGWELGIRPTSFKDHTNELTAVRYHLEDMRTLAKVIK